MLHHRADTNDAFGIHELILAYVLPVIDRGKSESIFCTQTAASILLLVSDKLLGCGLDSNLQFPDDMVSACPLGIQMYWWLIQVVKYWVKLGCKVYE